MKDSITYTRLMKRIDDGTADLHAWTNDGSEPMADVTFYKRNGDATRRHVYVTGKPVEGK